MDGDTSPAVTAARPMWLGLPSPSGAASNSGVHKIRRAATCLPLLRGKAGDHANSLAAAAQQTQQSCHKSDVLHSSRPSQGAGPGGQRLSARHDCKAACAGHAIGLQAARLSPVRHGSAVTVPRAALSSCGMIAPLYGTIMV